MKLLTTLRAAILLAAMPPNDTTFEEDLYVSLKTDSGTWEPFKSLGSDILTLACVRLPISMKDKLSTGTAPEVCKWLVQEMQVL